MKPPTLEASFNAALMEHGVSPTPLLLADLCRAAGKDTLTPRHRSVLRLLVCGWPSKNIAVELGISESTVEKAVKEIFDRLGIQSRMQLGALVAFATG